MITIVPLLLALHAWVGWRLVPPLAAWGAWLQVFAWAVLVMSAVLMPLAFLGRRNRIGASPVGVVVTWAGLIGMGWFSTLFVLTVVRDAVLVVALVAAVAAGLADGTWRSLDGFLSAPSPGFAWPPEGVQENLGAALRFLVSWSAAAVPLLAALATAWGLWNARRTATVVRIDVPITGLPDALHGFSVAQISDIHVGPTIRHAYVQRIVERVNALGADMVAITGDLVDGHVDDLRAHVAPLSRLVSTHGSFFVTGNHEYYSGAHAWITELRALGVQVLLNEHRVLHHERAADSLPDGLALQRDTEMIVVAGVADFNAHHFDTSHRSDPHAAIRGAPAGARLRLLLAHQPRSAQAAVGAGFDLQLSGHTHGGQFWPWMYFVRYQQPFTAGLRKLDDLWVYTNSGTGYWGPPKRFGVASEITHLRLVPA